MGVGRVNGCGPARAGRLERRAVAVWVIQDSFVITAWIKTDTTGLTGTYAHEGSGVFWSDIAGTANDFVVAVLGAKLSFFAGNPDVSVSSNADIVTGDWVYIAAVRNTTAKTLSVFVNGEFDNSVSHSNTSALNANSDLVIGSNTLDGRYYTGSIDEVRLFSRRLTDDQIAALYAGDTIDFGKAEFPNPADGQVGVTKALLQWTQGEGAVTHNVYLGTSPDLTETDCVASAYTKVFYFHAGGLVGGATYYWRVDEVEADGTIHTGDVWSFIAQADVAYYPTPKDGSNSIQLTSSLTWMAGKNAIAHHLYFGADANAVAAGTADVDQGEFEKRAGNVTMTGSVWSFSTVLPVEDFESYNDDDTRIYDAWLDGYANNTCSTVGNWNAPFAELTVVHDANQAMPLDYNNVDEPYYSEAQYEFASSQDWTVDDANALILYVGGKAGNPRVPLYVGLKDSSSRAAFVTHPDADITTTTEYVEWQIPLSEFTDVNLARIKIIYIGLGDRENPTPSDRLGRMYIDTICLGK